MYVVDYTKAVGEGLGQVPVLPTIGTGPVKVLVGLGILYVAYKFLTKKKKSTT